MTITSRSVGEFLGNVLSRSGAVAGVWCARVGEHADDVDRLSQTCLSVEEQERRLRYRSREAAERYVVTRSLVRTVLGERLGIAGRDVAISRTDTGKPVVTGGLHFNVSHSSDLVVLAVCAQRQVGVDIERRREIPRVDALVQRWLSPDERNDVAARAARGAQASEAFLRVWSLKEARIKALGVGIAGHARVQSALRDIEVSSLDHVLDAVDDSAYVGALAFA